MMSSENRFTLFGIMLKGVLIFRSGRHHLNINTP